MKAKRGALLLLAVLLLVGCSVAEETRGNQTTVPIDRIIEALNTGNTGLYESAFHPSFSAQYRTSYPDLSATLRDLLSVASEKNRTELGELKSIRYQITASREQELSSLEAYYGYTGLDAFLYEMPLESISAMREISLRITFEGSLDDFTAELTYRVLCIDGFWYLHPEAFGTVLRNE